MKSFGHWFDDRFEEVRQVLAGQPSTGAEPDEETCLRKQRTRYRDSLRLIVPELTAPGERTYADVGGGHLAWLVAPRFPGRTVALDLGGANDAEAQRLGVRTARWDVTAGDAPEPAGSFDVVSFTEVLEHLPPPPFPHVRRVGALLKPGGILLLTVPNMAAFMKRVKFLLFGRSPLKLGQVFTEEDGWPEHIREYTVPEVRRILDICGFEIERLRTGDYGWHAWRRATTLLHRVTTGWGRTIMVRARKRPS